MAKSRDRTSKEEKVEKKRKRQDNEENVSEEKPKKSRKSKLDQNAAATAELAIGKETSTDKKSKKEKKKSRRSAERKTEVAEVSSQVDGDDVPMSDANKDATWNVDVKPSKKERKEKKEKKVKKSKASAEVTGLVSDDGVVSNQEQNSLPEQDVPAADGTNVKPKISKASKKDKKEKKDKNTSKYTEEKKMKKESKEDNVDSTATPDQEPTSRTNGAAAAKGENADDAEAGNDADAVMEPEKKGRFIVFVGNLPYSATKESIKKHFAKLHPIDIRLRTYKGTDKFMGTCFVEFDRFDHMTTCLKKYHHSVFPDEKKKEGRKINVELSAGGGGNSEGRKSKIAAKNDKLHDERAKDREKRAEVESKQDERKVKKDTKKTSDKEDKNEAAETEETVPDNGGMHPARLAMMQAPQRPTHRQRF